MGYFSSVPPHPGWFSAAESANPQTWNLYAYGLNNPLINTDPDGYDCVYLNNRGTGLDDSSAPIDTNSNAGECKSNGGYWVDGTVSTINLFTNSNNVGLSGYAENNGNATFSSAYYASATGPESSIIHGMGYTGLTGTVDLVQLYQHRNPAAISAVNPIDVAAGCIGSGAVGVASDLSGYGLLFDLQQSAMRGSINPLLNSGDRLNDAGNAVDLTDKAASALEKTLPVAGRLGRVLGPLGAGITAGKTIRDLYNCVN